MNSENKELIVVEFLRDHGDYKKGDRTVVTLVQQYLVDEGVIKVVDSGKSKLEK